MQLKPAHRCREELLKTHLLLQGNQRVASGGNTLEDGRRKEELVKNTNKKSTLGKISLLITENVPLSLPVRVVLTQLDHRPSLVADLHPVGRCHSGVAHL